MLGFHPISAQPISTLGAVSGNVIIDLTTASLAFSAQPVTVLAAKLIDLTAATFSFLGQSVQLRLLVTLATPTFLFIAQAVEVIAETSAAGYNSLVGFLRNIGILKGR